MLRTSPFESAYAEIVLAPSALLGFVACIIGARKAKEVFKTLNMFLF